MPDTTDPSTILGVGADIWRGGWAIAVLRGDDAAPTVSITSAKTLAAGLAPWLVIDAVARPRIAVDVPLRVPDRKLRTAETAARDAVPGLGSTIFPAVPRYLWDMTHADGNALAHADLNTGFSAQAWGLIGSMKQAAALPALAPELVEAHPEVSFRCAQRTPTKLASKHSWTGMHQRIAILRDLGIVIPEDATTSVGIPDVLDATICAWTARRVALKSYDALGTPSDSWIAQPHPPEA